MKEGIIIYQSKYGATKKYADWMQEMTGFACIETPKALPNEVAQYETVVLCGGIYASGISGLSFLKKNISRLRDKKIAVFCVGASPYDEGALEEIRKHNLKGDLKKIPLFYGRGAWAQDNMTLRDRTLCKLLQKSIAKQDPGTYEPWMKALVSAFGQNHDWTDKKYLTLLFDYLGS